MYLSKLLIRYYNVDLKSFDSLLINVEIVEKLNIFPSLASRDFVIHVVSHYLIFGLTNFFLDGQNILNIIIYPLLSLKSFVIFLRGIAKLLFFYLK